MKTYHKIQTVWLRDPANRYRTLLEEEWATPEFEYLKHNEWTYTEKVDGTNVRIIYTGQHVAFTGKTDRAQLHPNLMNALEEMFTVTALDRVFGTDSVCLYGEGYGPKIQKGGKYRQDQSFVLFDVKVGDWWLRQGDVRDIASKLEIEVVPVVGFGDLYEMVEEVRAGFKSYWGDFMAEGIVARPDVELFARNGNRIITKLKYKDFAR